MNRAIEYWPEVSEVENCISTEAEELTGATVLAVHEPMTFHRIPARESRGEYLPEDDLLEHVINSSRPTPIIGESGFGKSHVIRWLDLKLREKRRDDWHIVRIPKNASLKVALTRLLDNLEGKEFDNARRSIEKVAVQLKTEEVAKIIAIFVESDLAKLYEDNKNLDLFDTEESKARAKVIRKHAKKDGLVQLLNDPNYSEQILGEGKCFFNIAKRLTEGSKSEEVINKHFQIHAKDLEYAGDNVGDLSQKARKYIRDSKFVIEEVREEVANLLNETISNASRSAFNQLFHFDSGSFQDLFNLIRVHLKNQGKTLFVLVEDLAAISAIEDVLLDSLMQEEKRDGEQRLCSLHSAIAVTTGYRGYLSRRNTLATRAMYEWKIESSEEDESRLRARVYDFCGRYLNAARIGEENLESGAGNIEGDEAWPPVWESNNKESVLISDSFGESSAGHPLYPYTKTALRALTDKYCMPDGELEFNPRKILQHILREPLAEMRGHHIEGNFPPAGFASLRCPSSLQASLRQELPVNADLERCETFAAVWGFGSAEIAHMAHTISPHISTEFGLGELTPLLETTTPIPPPEGLGLSVVPKIEESRPRLAIAPIGLQGGAENISRDVDEYFKTKNIPQKEANLIRNSLYFALERHKKASNDWYGSLLFEDVKKARSLVAIEIPYNKNNSGSILKFGSEKEFTGSNRLFYHQYMVAVLRNHHYNKSEKKIGSWDYEGGVKDFLNYQNFLDNWISGSLQKLMELARGQASIDLKEHYSISSIVEPGIGKKSLSEKIELLVTDDVKIKEKFNLNTGFEDWDAYTRLNIDNWGDHQRKWLSAFTTNNRYSIEGDIVKNILRGSPDVRVPSTGLKIVQKTIEKIRIQFPALELLADITNQEDYITTLNKMKGVVEKLSSNDQFETDRDMTARKFVNLLQKLIEKNEWSRIKATLALLSEFEPTVAVSSLQKFDLETTKNVNEAMANWRSVYDINCSRIKSENDRLGLSKRQELERELANRINSICNIFDVEFGS